MLPRNIVPTAAAAVMLRNFHFFVKIRAKRFAPIFLLSTRLRVPWSKFKLPTKLLSEAAVKAADEAAVKAAVVLLP
jgi:hypothetical protein